MFYRSCYFSGHCLQLFRESLSGKVHATILKGIVGGFEFSFFQRNLKELARKAMEMCLRVLKESKKSSFDNYSRQDYVLIMSHVTFRACCGHSFSDNLSRNSCKKNRFHVAVGLFINRSRKTSKCCKKVSCSSCATYFVFTTFFCPL